MHLLISSEFSLKCKYLPKPKVNFICSAKLKNFFSLNSNFPGVHLFVWFYPLSEAFFYDFSM